MEQVLDVRRGRDSTYPRVCTFGTFGVDFVYQLVDVGSVENKTLRFKPLAYALAADLRVCTSRLRTRSR